MLSVTLTFEPMTMDSVTRFPMQYGYCGNRWHLPEFMAIFSLCMCRICYFYASARNPDIDVRFSNPQFPKKAIIWQSDIIFWRFSHKDL